MLFFVTFSLTFWAMGTYLFASSRRNPAPVPRFVSVLFSYFCLSLMHSTL